MLILNGEEKPTKHLTNAYVCCIFAVVFIHQKALKT